MKGTPITTSAFAGMGPAALKSAMIFSQEATVPLDFQFPPRRYLRVPSGAASPLEEPAGREQLSANAMVEIGVEKYCTTETILVTKCVSKATVAKIRVWNSLNPEVGTQIYR